MEPIFIPKRGILKKADYCYLYQKKNGKRKKIHLRVNRHFFLFHIFNQAIPPSTSPLIPTHLVDEEMHVVYKCILMSYLAYKDRSLIQFPEDISIEFEKFDSGIAKIPFFIVVDNTIHAIIVSCRGSRCMDDFVTDSMGNGVNFDGGKVHQGVFNAASYVFLESQNRIIELNRKYNGEYLADPNFDKNTQLENPHTIVRFMDRDLFVDPNLESNQEEYAPKQLVPNYRDFSDSNCPYYYSDTNDNQSSAFSNRIIDRIPSIDRVLNDYYILPHDLKYKQAILHQVNKSINSANSKPTVNKKKGDTHKNGEKHVKFGGPTIMNKNNSKSANSNNSHSQTNSDKTKESTTHNNQNTQKRNEKATSKTNQESPNNETKAESSNHNGLNKIQKEQHNSQIKNKGAKHNNSKEQKCEMQSSSPKMESKEMLSNTLFSNKSKKPLNHTESKHDTKKESAKQKSNKRQKVDENNNDESKHETRKGSPKHQSPTKASVQVNAKKSIKTPNQKHQKSNNGAKSSNKNQPKMKHSHPPYQIIITGHSLGAAVAAVVAHLFRRQLPELNVKCICFAPPPTYSFNLWQRSGSYIKSFMIEGDLVPFLSLLNVINFSKVLFSKSTGKSITRFIENYLKKMSIDEITEQYMNEKLYPPGQMYLIRFPENNPLKKDLRDEIKEIRQRNKTNHYKDHPQNGKKAKKPTGRHAIKEWKKEMAAERREERQWDQDQAKRMRKFRKLQNAQEKEEKYKKNQKIRNQNIELCQIFNPEYFSRFVKNIQETNHKSKNYLKVIIRIRQQQLQNEDLLEMKRQEEQKYLQNRVNHNQLL